jgi:hypothetical protein
VVTSLLAAAIASLVGTPHCLGMCGGFATAAARTPLGLGGWHVGRIGTYTVLGAVAGGVGGWVPGPSWVLSLISLVLLIWFAAALAGFAPEPRIVWPGLVRAGAWAAGRQDLPARVAFGVINGLLPCGLVYATVGMAVSAGGWWQGALTMGVFGLGTLPGLSAWAWGARTLLSAYPWSRKVLALGVLVAGICGLLWRQGA